MKSIKKTLSMTIAIILLVSSFAMTAFADNIKVVLDGKAQTYDQPPVLKNGRTLVPMRGIFEALGATITWDEKTSTVEAVKGDIKVVLTIGNDVAKVNNKETKLDVAPELINSRTMVPLRFVSESLKAEVTWEAETQTVNIKSAAAPAETAPTDTTPAETAPTDTTPAETAPADTIPADTSARKSYEWNFDDGKFPDELKTDLTGVKATGTITIEDNALKADRSAEIGAAYDEAAVLAAGFNAEATRGELVFDAPLTGVITVEYKLKTAELTGTKQFQAIGNGINSDGVEADVTIAATNFASKNFQIGAVTGGKATKIGDTVANEWINLKVVIDINKNNVDYYINGEKKHSQAMQNTATDVKLLRLNINGKHSGTIFADEIKVTAN